MDSEIEIIGDLSEDILSRELTLATSNLGSQTRSGRWKNWTGQLRDFINFFCIHKEGEKDGNCFVSGECVEGERRSSSIKSMQFCSLDLDTGESLDELIEKIQKIGLFAIIYTTHSHMKDVSDVKRDAIINWVDKDGNVEPTLENVKDYFKEVKRYRPYILDNAILLDTQHTKEGVKMFIKHAPMPKFRVILPLDQPFIFNKRKGKQQDAIQEWKELYAGTSKLLGCYFDRSCVDPSRLFYTARHPKGAQDFHTIVVGGRLLRLITGSEGQPADVGRVTAQELKRGQLDVYEAAANALGGGEGKDNYKTPGIKAFFGKHAKLFELESWLLEVEPENDRGGRSNGPGRTHKCPNDDAHSNSGDEHDRGFYCINGTESETESCLARCSHDSCSGLDRINFVDLVCTEHKLTVDDLMKYVVEIENDDDSVENDDKYKEEDEKKEEELKPFKSMSNAQDALNNLQDGDIEAFGKFARQVGLSKLTVTDKAVLKAEVMKKKTIEVKHWNEEVKLGQQILKGENADGVDKDILAALKEYNKIYAKVLHGGTCKIMKKPQKIGDACSFMGVDAFKSYRGHDTIRINGDKDASLPAFWMTWPGVEAYDKIEFEPGKVVEKEHYNIWVGFKVKPKQGSWNLLEDHIKYCICGGDEAIFYWFKTWLADLFQNPGDKKGSAVVLRGKKGTGKSILFKILRDIIGPHCMTVSSKSAFLGDFNAHQMGLILLICEEASWAGDISANGKLKALITDDVMTLTPKGVDSFDVSNHLHLAFVSNEGFVVPASLSDERRYLVMDITSDHIGDLEYFQKIIHQMYKQGGMEAMLYDLLKWIPENNDWDILRTPPTTDALVDQGKANLHSWDRFFLQFIQDGIVSIVPQIDGLAPVVLNKNDETFINKMQLREYYYRHVGKTNSHKIGDQDTFDSCCEDWLYADGNEYSSDVFNQDGPFSGSSIIKVPSLVEIRQKITEEKGIKFKTTIKQSIPNL